MKHLQNSYRFARKQFRSIRRLQNQLKSRIEVAGRPKIFGIGFNKTGTTSLTVAMRELGFIVGNQKPATLLLDDWAKRDFRRLIRYCKTAQFFQDVPFSLPYTYIVMDQAFPGSKFILTVRDSAEQWYNSLAKFHAKKFGKNGRVPTKEDLQNATHIYKGSPWHHNRLRSITPEDDLYNRDLLIRDYLTHIRMVREYFLHRPDDLLVLNVGEKGAHSKLAQFLEVSTERSEFSLKKKT